MEAENISQIQISNFADFTGKDGAVVTVRISDMLDCMDSNAIYYGITASVSRGSMSELDDIVNIAVFSNREECLAYAKSLAAMRKIPLNDATVI